jgi:hypothetical protein
METAAAQRRRAAKQLSRRSPHSLPLRMSGALLPMQPGNAHRCSNIGREAHGKTPQN